VLRLHDLILDFQPADADTVLERWLDSGEANPASGYTRQDYTEHLRTEYSTFRWPLEPMLTAAGLDIVAADFNRPAYGACAAAGQSARGDAAGWQHSADVAVTVSGDATGLHVLAAPESSGYAWRTVATLGDPAAQTDLWIGQARETSQAKSVTMPPGSGLAPAAVTASRDAPLAGQPGGGWPRRGRA
jgi:hypothetical protein